VPVSDQARETLARTLAIRPAGSRNLIAPSETYAQVAIARDSELNRAREVLHAQSLPGYHDARAAYACERYQTLTGRAAPVVSGQRPTATERASDASARMVIARELGHGRIDVLAAYVGGR
jgi:hypothetical protein